MNRRSRRCGGDGLRARCGRGRERNAENVVELHDAGLSDRLAAYVDGLRDRYPLATPPAAGPQPVAPATP